MVGGVRLPNFGPARRRNERQGDLVMGDLNFLPSKSSWITQVAK